MKTSQMLRSLELSMLILAAIVGHLSARDLIVAWDANPEPDIAGYVLTITNGPRTREIDVPDGTELTTDLIDGDTITVRAYNTLGFHSPESDSISIKAPGKPGGLRVVEIQTSANLKDWRTIALVPQDPAEAPAEFVRARIASLPTAPE